MEEQDLAALRVAGPAGGTLRVRHHRIARMAAAGLEPREIGEVMALDADTVEMILHSRAMKDLVAEYRVEDAVEDRGLQKRAKLLALAGLAELQKRLETQPQEVGTKTLADLTMGLLDRTTVGPKVTFVGLFSSGDLERLREADRVIRLEGPRALPAQAADPLRPFVPESVGEEERTIDTSATEGDALPASAD
jgi:hypothetical protein